MDYETPDLLVREIHGVCIVRLRNPALSAPAEVQRIQAEIVQLLKTRTRKLVIDFKYVDYLSSAALGLLLTVHKEMERVQGKLVLSHTEKIAELLRVSQTEKLFVVAPDPKEAYKLF